MSNHTTRGFIICCFGVLCSLLACWTDLGFAGYFLDDCQGESTNDMMTGPLKSVSTRMGDAPVRIVDEYLPSGRLAEQKWNDARNGELQAKLVFDYDANGRKTKKVKFGRDNAINFSETYFYNEKGFRVGATLYDKDGSIETVTVFRCEADGKLKGRFQLNTSRNYAVMSSYTHDKNGKLEKEFRQELTEKGLTTTKIARTYGQNGLLLEEIESRSKGLQFVKRVYVYDAQRNPVSQSNFGPDGRVTDKWMMEYEFDSHGNWTSRRAKRAIRDGKRNGESVLSERTIIYYSQ